jgi:hypothetical protein
MWPGIKNRESLNYMANAKNIYIIENKAKLAPMIEDKTSINAFIFVWWHF